MKKLLLTTAAIGLAMAATPANAEVDLSIGGYAKVYGAFTDHDEVSGGRQSNDFDMVRETELHLTGQTTLDNGLTVGAHFETEADGSDAMEVEESYLYFSGNWGRVNLGAEDGAAYLLQVAAPSADSNVDGIRQYINPVNTTVLTNTAGGVSTTTFDLDYDQDITGKSDKITYMTPVFSGFQAGVSYSPDGGDADDLEGVGLDDREDVFGAAYEVAARYEGQFEQVGFILGAGYSQIELENNTTVVASEETDDRTAWNVGLDLDMGPFGLGVVYMEDDNGEVALTAAGGAATSIIDDEETFVVGLDYTTGNFKFGASYLEAENYDAQQDVDASRYAVGVQYTYGPGMTFNGSVGYVEYEGIGADLNNNGTVAGAEANQDREATYVLIGTQVNF